MSNERFGKSGPTSNRPSSLGLRVAIPPVWAVVEARPAAVRENKRAAYDSGRPSGGHGMR